MKYFLVTIHKTLENLMSHTLFFTKNQKIRLFLVIFFQNSDNESNQIESNRRKLKMGKIFTFFIIFKIYDDSFRTNHHKLEERVKSLLCFQVSS